MKKRSPPSPSPGRQRGVVERIASAEQSEVPDLSMAAFMDEEGELDADAFAQLVELYDESMRTSPRATSSPAR